MAGVFCGDHFFQKDADLLLYAIPVAFCGLLSIVFYFAYQHKQSWSFGISFALFCLSAGWFTITCQLKHSLYKYPEQEAIYRALLLEDPERKEHSYLCEVILKEWRDSTSIHPIEKKAILYLAQDSTVLQLKEGNELWIRARISLPNNKGNFDEFDYQRYLMRKGVSGTGYVANKNWMLSGQHSVPSVRQQSDAYRDKLINLYQQLGFDGDELAVLAALTVGDKTELSEDILESYSISGASHVLALSGLHIGLLYMLLLYLLRWITPKRYIGIILQSIVTLLLLWAFAFFTGLSPSVVRSAFMFSMLALARIFNRTAVSLNTIAVVAWLMLWIHPAWLFDVGFQLSFMAVIAILLIQPLLFRLLPINNRIGKYIWGLMTVSIAAQIGTAPLVAFYFARFSTHFLLTNLIVVPLVTLILYIAVFMLLLTPISILQMIAATICHKMIEGLNGFVRWIEHLPFASIDGIWLYTWEIVILYILILLYLSYQKKKSFRKLSTCLLCLLLLIISSTTARWIDRPQRSIVFYNISRCPAVHFIGANGESWLNLSSWQKGVGYLRRTASNYWRRINLLSPIEVTKDFHQKDFFREQQILAYHGCRIGMITDNRWLHQTTQNPFPLHYLYLCKGYNGSLQELLQVFHPSHIILDSSLSEHRKQIFIQECKQQKLPFTSLAETGSIRFSF